MNILIEDAETQEYLTGDSKWTKEASEGRNFGAAAAAIAVAKKEPIGKFNIVIFIPQTKQFINLDQGRGKGLAEVMPVMETATAVT